MKKKPKAYNPKTPEPHNYIKELHHTCNNMQICKEKINPNETCEGCKYYKLLEVDVALVPQRDEVDWGF